MAIDKVATIGSGVMSYGITQVAAMLGQAQGFYLRSSYLRTLGLILEERPER